MNQRYSELLILFVLILIISFFSFSIAGLLSLGFIWNWTLQFDIEKLKTNRRYRFSTIKLVFNLNQLIERFFAPRKRTKVLVRILPAGTIWLIVSWFLGSLEFWWAPFLGSALYELLLAFWGRFQRSL